MTTVKPGTPSPATGRRSPSTSSSPMPCAPGFVEGPIAPRLSVSKSTTESDSDSISGASSGSVCVPTPVKVESADQGAQMIGVSPFDMKEVKRSEKYRNKKVTQCKTMLQETLLRAAGQTTKVVPDAVNFEDAGREMISQLKAKFIRAQTYAEKIKILSLLPGSWSSNDIKKVFPGATSHMVRITSQLVAEQGILCSPNPKKGKGLSSETEKLVTAFYLEPDVSREMAGKKECIVVKEDGGKVTKTKRLVLGNLRDIYLAFCKKYPNVEIGFSKFASLRPPECVLAGSAGTHTVCVCTTHQNFLLMFMGAHLGSLKDGDTKVCESWHDIVNSTMCLQPKEECHFGKCKKCPGSEKIEKKLVDVLLTQFVEKITYKQWIKDEKGRYLLSTFVLRTQDFVEKLVEAIPEVRQHDFIAKQQAEYFSNRRDNLEYGEVLVVADFSENYSFIIQDAVQGAYWNNQQATIHPFAMYFRNPETGKVEADNLVIISDHLKHVTSTVSKFQDVLMDYLKKKHENLAKVIYFSDGCAGQYKNRFNMKNVAMHEADYGVPAEWHFFATSHGKGPSDGLGGTLKRLATRASLQRPYEDQIQTPEELHAWAATSLKGLNCVFVKSAAVRKHERKLNRRFSTAVALGGIRSHHSMIPLSATTLLMKVLSSSEIGNKVSVVGGAEDVDEEADVDDVDAVEVVQHTPSPGVSTRSRAKRRRTVKP
ncbi:uncharacterized protein LOC117644795 [Thrips palmi]|uniref:Uncharacterized protein LOC117644795 n=1 Tax=Thrips palmi TaxID=161013 RepID=A0A6P8YSG1_THRPL|nr:uncharacterized protein LOC117644795 [Thrips palmi]